MHTEHLLIIWNEESQKWMDQSNDYFCSKTLFGDTWEVRARYGFPDGERVMAFATEHEAMAFFVNFLHTRIMNLTVEGYAIRDRKKEAAA